MIDEVDGAQKFLGTVIRAIARWRKGRIISKPDVDVKVVHGSSQIQLSRGSIILAAEVSQPGVEVGVVVQGVQIA